MRQSALKWVDKEVMALEIFEVFHQELTLVGDNTPFLLKTDDGLNHGQFFVLKRTLGGTLLEFFAEVSAQFCAKRHASTHITRNRATCFARRSYRCLYALEAHQLQALAGKPKHITWIQARDEILLYLTQHLAALQLYFYQDSANNCSNTKLMPHCHLARGYGVFALFNNHLVVIVITA